MISQRIADQLTLAMFDILTPEVYDKHTTITQDKRPFSTIFIYKEHCQPTPHDHKSSVRVKMKCPFELKKTQYSNLMSANNQNKFGKKYLLF